MVVSRQPDYSEVIRELSKAGVTAYGLMKSESRYLPRILHSGEHIHAVVYGQHNDSSAMLIATDERVIYLDKKLMSVFIDEVTYDVVSGIELDIHTFFATVTLHTAVANYQIRYANIRCADNFADYIEEQRVRREIEQRAHDNPPAPAAAESTLSALSTREKSTQKLAATIVKNDLAGYYLIPFQENSEETY